LPNDCNYDSEDCVDLRSWPRAAWSTAVASNA